ncbi:glycosyltransferase [Nocardioides sp. CER19]|uniref:glycosyltransferase n=1 Tax=Nocardioides sp. CER19 TaxID=3038538 RepID=UPI00244897A8|nr:glycosyltransferase [Nocardioides sp. CER19]MDH2414646.1 glycosyltransferase [Nocardioides sp. CER19]
MNIFVWSKLTLGNGSFHYRVNAPMTEIAWQQLANVSIGGDPTVPAGADADVLVVHGLVQHDLEEALAAMPDRPRLVVIENDDNHLDVRPDNPMFSAEGGGVSFDLYVEEVLPRIRRSLELADLVTVTVPYLAEIYAQHTDAPVVVLPNTIDEVLLEVPQPVRAPGEQLRVGWAGSASHTLDWRLCADGVRYGLAKTQAHLVLMGADYRSLIGYRDAEYLPWADSMDEYYLPMTTWHVALAPLGDDAFNRSKSPLKALEAAAFGIPVVASDAGPYRDFVVDGETGFLCRSDTDWMKAIRALGNDEEMRREMGRKAREVARDLTTQAWAPRWVEAYRQAQLEPAAGR